MVRYLPIGNGRLLVSFDSDYRIIDFYYSKELSENHSAGKPFMFGIQVNQDFSWIDKRIIYSADYLSDTMVGNIKCKVFDIFVECDNFVDIYEDIYVKKVWLKNDSNENKTVRLFFHQNFYIYGTNIGDTAIYYPDLQGMIHYKGRRYFYASTIDSNNNVLDQYAAGVKDFEGHEGTWRDAEDGELSMNPVAIGSVDSVIRHSIELKPSENKMLYYYIICGESLDDIRKILQYLTFKKLYRMEIRTANYWKAWHETIDLKLENKLISLFRRSLFIIRNHMNDLGAIVASSDSEILKSNRDEYYYVWPRDAAIATNALILAGHYTAARKFFQFAKKVVSPHGYFYHKYRTDGNLASSWIPLIYKNKNIVPIQEDETALVIWCLGNYMRKTNDIEFLYELYEPLVLKCANFMLNFREPNGLPKESFDVWEERYGIHTYTVATTYAALKAAYEIAMKFGDVNYAIEFEKAAHEMKESFEKYFYSDSKGYYARAIIDGQPDFTLDSAVMSIFLFGMKDPLDRRVENTMNNIMNRLWVKKIGGIARYENDRYQRVKEDKEIPGNPWIITTLWAAQYYLDIGNVDRAYELIKWVSDHAQTSGILSEQINPYDGSPLSVAPLIWSHSEFVITLFKLDELQRIKETEI